MQTFKEVLESLSDKEPIKVTEEIKIITNYNGLLHNQAKTNYRDHENIQNNR